MHPFVLTITCEMTANDYEKLQEITLQVEEVKLLSSNNLNLVYNSSKTQT